MGTANLLAHSVRPSSLVRTQLKLLVSTHQATAAIFHKLAVRIEANPSRCCWLSLPWPIRALCAPFSYYISLFNIIIINALSGRRFRRRRRGRR